MVKFVQSFNCISEVFLLGVYFVRTTLLLIFLKLEKLWLAIPWKICGASIDFWQSYMGNLLLTLLDFYSHTSIDRRYSVVECNLINMQIQQSLQYLLNVNADDISLKYIYQCHDKNNNSNGHKNISLVRIMT